MGQNILDIAVYVIPSPSPSCMKHRMELSSDCVGTILDISDRHTKAAMRRYRFHGQEIRIWINSSDNIEYVCAGDEWRIRAAPYADNVKSHDYKQLNRKYNRSPCNRLNSPIQSYTSLGFSQSLANDLSVILHLKLGIIYLLKLDFPLLITLSKCDWKGFCSFSFSLFFSKL